MFEEFNENKAICCILGPAVDPFLARLEQAPLGLEDSAMLLMREPITSIFPTRDIGALSGRSALGPEMTVRHDAAKLAPVKGSQIVGEEEIREGDQYRS